MTNSRKRGLMTRRDLLRGTAVSAASAAALAVFGSPGMAWAESVVTLRAAHVESTDSATHKAYVAFAEKVKAATNGSVEVQVFPAGQLGNLRDLYEGLGLGSIDLTSSGPDYTANIAPVMVTAALYYSYSSPEQADRALQGEFSNRLSDALAKNAGMQILAWGELGWRSVFNVKQPITGAADFKGLKLRVPEANLHILPMKALGAAPTPIPYADVYTSMQTGIVDGAEGTPAVVTQQKFDEVAKYYSLTRHLYNPLHLVISDIAMSRLSDEQKKAVKQAAREAFNDQRIQARADNKAALDTLVKGGIAVNEDLDAAALREIVKPTWDVLTKDLGAEGQNLVNLLLNA